VIDDVDGLHQTARVFLGEPFAKVPVIYKGKKAPRVGRYDAGRDKGGNQAYRICIFRLGWIKVILKAMILHSN